MGKLFKHLLIIAIPTAAYAGGVTQTNDGSGAYLNFNAGVATQQFLPSGGLALNVNAGYNFNRGLALEGGYTSLTSSQYNSNLSNNIFDVAVKGTLPFSQVFSLYGRLGAGLNYATWGGTANNAPAWYCDQAYSANFNVLAGVGASFALSQHFDLRLEDTMLIPVGSANQTSGNINLVLGGFQYNF